MIIKKYVAETMSDALTQVRKELGEDAVILQSRQIEKSGLLSFLGKPMVEITAATPDPSPPVRKSVQLTQQQKELLVRNPVEQKPVQRPEVNQSSPVQTINRTQTINNQNDRSKVLENNTINTMQAEISELRESMKELATHLKYQNVPSLPEKLVVRWKQLVDNGVNERKAHDLTQLLHKEINNSNMSNDEQIDAQLRSLLVKRINTGRIPFMTGQNRALTIALIGPTGVGKTTTLAKLATNRKIFGSKGVALVSTDTYRVAAVEQLQTFANIAGLPMEVVYRPDELPKAIEIHQDKDVVLVDTAGRSQNDSGAMLELLEFMEAAQPDEILLVLSAGTRIEDQQDMINRFGQIPSTRVILTKMDEISSAGHLLDLSEMLPRQWVYLTIGQNVPDDIILADPTLLARMVESRDNFNRVRRSSFLKQVTQ